ncbi:MAG: leucine-rich repeat protein [Ruminococcus flavefaciens]|nr:leucine-rich repeat protein [Ruminococcus flavefaciens]
MKKSRKIVAGIMAVCLAFGVTVIPESVAPVVSMAESTENPATWSLDDETGILTISGTGKMMEINSWSGAPWKDDKDFITEIVIEDGITNVSANSFKNCKYLKKVTLPNSVTSIENEAFNGCAKLTSINIPANLETVGRKSFENCTDLTTPMIFPETLKSVEYGAFSGCSSLTTASFPSSLTSIPDYLFANCSNLENVSISDGITEIKPYAFSRCEKLPDITLPNTLTTIEEGAFQYCQAFVNFNMPDSVKTLGNNTFLRCSNLETVKLSNKLREVPFNAFSECESLKEVTIPKNVMSLSSNTFLKCSSLEKIVVLNPECEFSTSLGGNKEKTVIYGYTGSTAQTYAEKYNYQFVALDEESTTDTTAGLLGDTNCDGKVSIADAVLIMQSLSNPSNYKLTEEQALNGDVVDRGNGLTPIDALAIQMVDLEIITADDLPITSEELNNLLS